MSVGVESVLTWQIETSPQATLPTRVRARRASSSHHRRRTNAATYRPPARPNIEWQRLFFRRIYSAANHAACGSAVGTGELGFIDRHVGDDWHIGAYLPHLRHWWYARFWQ